MALKLTRKHRPQIKDGLCEITCKSRTCSEISKWALTATQSYAAGVTLSAFKSIPEFTSLKKVTNVS